MKNGITLNLTPKEAKVLEAILWSIGDPPSGTRGLADSVSVKLNKQHDKFYCAKVDLTLWRHMNSRIQSISKIKYMKYPEWTLIDWDGNRELNYKCWCKSFGRGHVSIGVGKFDLIVYSHGANSDDSMSGTRKRTYCGKPDQTEEAAKAMVDRNRGYHNSKDVD